MKQLFICWMILTLLIGSIGLVNAAPVTSNSVGPDSRLFINGDHTLYQYDRSTQEIISSLFAIYDVENSNFTFFRSLRELAFDENNNMYLANYAMGQTTGILKMALPTNLWVN